MRKLRCGAAPVLLLSLAGGLVACGDGGDEPAAAGSSAPSGSPSGATDTASDAASNATSNAASAPADAGDPAAELKKILQAYTDGDADFACGRQTAKYTAYSIDVVVSSDALPAGATCADTVRFSSQMAKQYNQNNVDGAYDVTANDGARATVVHDQGGSPVTYRLVVEDGVWKIDADR